MCWQDVPHIPDLQRDRREHGAAQDVPQPTVVQNDVPGRRAGRVPDR